MTIAINDLDGLIRRIHLNFNRASKALIEIGADLIEAKKAVPSGQWVEWLDHNFGMSVRSAQNFMSVAREFQGRELPDLPQKVLYLLSSPRVSDSVREAVIEEAQQGHAPTVERVREMQQEGIPGVYIGDAAVLDTTKKSALTKGQKISLLSGFPADPRKWVYVRRESDGLIFVAMREHFASDEPVEPEVLAGELVDEPINDWPVGLSPVVADFLEREDLEGLVLFWVSNPTQALVSDLHALGWEFLLDAGWDVVKPGNQFFKILDGPEVVRLIESHVAGYEVESDSEYQSVEEEICAAGERLGLPTGGDQVLPDPDREKLHRSPHDVDDRPFAALPPAERPVMRYTISVVGIGIIHELVSAIHAHGWHCAIMETHYPEGADE